MHHDSIWYIFSFFLHLFLLSHCRHLNFLVVLFDSIDYWKPGMDLKIKLEAVKWPEILENGIEKGKVGQQNKDH